MPERTQPGPDPGACKAVYTGSIPVGASRNSPLILLSDSVTANPTACPEYVRRMASDARGGAASRTRPSGDPNRETPASPMLRMVALRNSQHMEKLTRSETDRVIAGVAGGIAQRLGVNSTLVTWVPSGSEGTSRGRLQRSDRPVARRALRARVTIALTKALTLRVEPSSPAVHFAGRRSSQNTTVYIGSI